LRTGRRPREALGDGGAHPGVTRPRSWSRNSKPSDGRPKPWTLEANMLRVVRCGNDVVHAAHGGALGSAMW
jgi:hypothetical protein